MLSLTVAVYLIGTATIIWSGIANKPYIAVLIGLVWAGLILALKKYNLGIPKMMASSAFVLVAAVVTILTTPGKDGPSIIKNLISDKPATVTTQIEQKSELPDPAGTVLVDGKTGVLTNAGSLSNISDIERDNGHGEAYLADKNATATYNFEATTAGAYRLWVKLSDDGEHLDGSRSATVLLNNAQTIRYNHLSENTKGWKWYDLGSTTLTSGINTIAFTKDDTTSAAYVMNQFKFVPVE